jgi:nitrate/nitrite transporter NarK
LLSSKLSATPIRGQFYGVAAAWGKVGAFIGTFLFPRIIAAAGDDENKQRQFPFWVSSSLCVFSVFVVCAPYLPLSLPVRRSLVNHSILDG